MTGKQRPLASFWGAKPASTATNASASGEGAASTPKKRERDQESGAAPTKLRKPAEEAAPTQTMKAAAADLEDSDDEQQLDATAKTTPAPAQPRSDAAPDPSTSKAQDGAAKIDEGEPMKSPGKDAFAAMMARPAPSKKKAKVEVRAAADSDEDASSVADDDSGDEEGTAEAGSTKKSTKRPKAAKKLDGAGQLAVQYAEDDIDELEASCKAGEAVPYEFLADCLEEIANESKRLVITGTLTKRLRALLRWRPNELLPTVYLCVNRVAAPHEGVELGIGDATLIKALASATGRSEAKVKEEYAKLGDLGLIAVKAKNSQRSMLKPKRLTIEGVFKSFKTIAKMEGSGSQAKKQGAISRLLADSQGVEAGYIIRSLQGKLRIGLAEQTVLAALSHAVLLHHMEKNGEEIDAAALPEKMAHAEAEVKRAYNDCPSYDALIPALIEHGLDDLTERCTFQPGLPVKPMLAKATNGVQEVLDKFEGRMFSCEYKYDGERAQVHVTQGGKKVRIFSRNSEDMTAKYPDVVARIPRALTEGTSDVVLDCEAVAWDPATKQILPFQKLSTRARKDVTVHNITVQVILFAFDCLYYNGTALLKEPLTKRRDAMRRAIQAVPGEVEFAVHKESTDFEELSKFLDDSIAASTEGLIVKTMDDSYEPSKRSLNWLKLKKDYLNAGGDTIDAVPIGAWYGKGKRAGVYGSFLLAIYNPDEETYETLCKIGTGFSEEQLVAFSEQLKDPQDKPRTYYRYGETLLPDVWFEPQHVWEIKVADLSMSPVHRAAIGMLEPSRGISVRFPRLMRVRDDKTPEMATTADQIVDMFKSQAVYAGNAKGATDD